MTQQPQMSLRLMGKSFKKDILGEAYCSTESNIVMEAISLLTLFVPKEVTSCHV